MNDPRPTASQPDELTDDALAGDLRVWQRRKGHRYSLDDTLTAWVAAQAVLDGKQAVLDGKQAVLDGKQAVLDGKQAVLDGKQTEGPLSVLDLGCGIGSVLLMLAYKLPTARLFGLEAQTQSHALACSNVSRNQLEGRVSVALGDLREARRVDSLVKRNAGPFMLVTGTPPYLPPEQGTVPPDSQRAHARFELRGGVEAYMQAAARVLHPAGRFVMCAGARADERVVRGANSAGLEVLEVLPALPSVSKGVLFSVWTFRATPNATAQALTARAPRRLAPFIARDEHGARTQAALDLRAFFGLPLPQDEPSSPLQRPRKQRTPETRSDARDQDHAQSS